MGMFSHSTTMFNETLPWNLLWHTKHVWAENGHVDLNRYQDVNIEETDSEITLRFEAPGFTENDLDITIESGILLIKGTRNSQRSSTVELLGKIVLPQTIDPTQIKVSVDNGILSLILPKTDETTHA